MKISAIGQNYFNHYKIQNSKTNKTQNFVQKENLSMPTSAHYLSFTAGFTIDLAQTYSRLNSEDYPQDIEEMTLEELKAKNPENKTLHDIHFEKYKGVLDCYSLDELKEKYPEFEDVVSAFDVKAKDESFIGKFQNNELELFSNDEDLTLQLIKLYWGQGFSLSDLSNYIAKQDKDNKGINLYYTMKKLNIPLMNPRYANILKLSNKEYNERFTSQLAIKLKEAHEAKIQKQEGEPVVIPRGELSEAHKKHISDGLKKHYQEHPEKLFEMSKRQKAFYQQNPERAKEMSEIMFYAWNETQEGKSLMKHISKFMKKFNGSTITAQEISDFTKLDSEKRNAIDAFWKKNGWAKKQLSIAMKKAFEYKKEDKEDLRKRSEAIKKIKLTGKTIPNVQISYNVVPTKLQNNIKAWAKAQGYDTKDMLFGVATIYNDDDLSFMENEYVLEYQNKVNAITEEYYELHPEEPDAIATALQYSLAKLQIDLSQNNIKALPPSLRKNDGKLNVIKYAFNNIITSGNPIFKEQLGILIPIQGVDVNDIHLAYNAILYQAMVCGCEDLAQYLNRRLDEGYEKYKKEIK